MMCTPAIRNLIRSSKTHQIYSLMQTGGRTACRPWTRVSPSSSRTGRITEAVAFDRCRNEDDLRKHLNVSASILIDEGDPWHSHSTTRSETAPASLVEGQLEGDSMALVVGKLREMGYMPISVTPKAKVSLKTEITIPGSRTASSCSEVAVVTRQLATMIDSGLSVVRALGDPRRPGREQELARVLAEVRMDVERGSSLSAACASTPRCSAKLFVTWSRPARSAETSTRSCSTSPRRSRSRRTEREDQVGHDVPGGRAVVMVHHLPGHADLHRPGVQEPLRDRWMSAAAPTLILIHISNIILSLGHDRDRLVRRRDRGLQAVDRDRERQGQVGPVQAAPPCSGSWCTRSRWPVLGTLGFSRLRRSRSWSHSTSSPRRPEHVTVGSSCKRPSRGCAKGARSPTP